MLVRAMDDFLELVDLAAERLGGSVLWATDDFFAEKENLLKPAEAIFIDGKYTDRGKWMDGWESRRKRNYAESSRAYPDHDTCIIRLGLPGVVRGFVVDTAFFKGNYPSECAIEGASIEGQPDVTELLAARWTPILPRSPLKGDHKNLFAVKRSERFTHLRFHIFPDGGVARLRVHGDVLPARTWMGPRARPQIVDLAAADHGGLVTACNDMFFGSRHNLIMPGRGVNMGDGWETKRSRRAGPDWVVVRLATEGAIERVVVDTTHFKGNAPDACAIEVIASERDPDGAREEGWVPLLAKTSLQPHTTHTYDVSGPPATHARLRIWPDGGVSRLRLFGTPSAEGRVRAGLRALRAMPDPELEAALRACCGSSAWVREMVAARPFDDFSTLVARAHAIWHDLGKENWDEAFRAHPRIGETKAQAHQGEQARAWSAGEQAGVTGSSAATREGLREANRAYEERFARIYIVCATGKSAEEMLAIAKERLGSDPETELRRAAAEQAKITELRLEKLVNG
jgi:allantoicase